MRGLPQYERLCFAIALFVMIACSGCIRSSEMRSAGHTLHNWPYQSAIVRRQDDSVFYWYITQDRKKVMYEPCCGMYDIELKKESNSELVFTITESHGRPLDLRTGRVANKSDGAGKEFEAKIEGDQIISVSKVR